MGRKQQETEELFDDDFSVFQADLDVDDVIAQIHSDEIWEPAGGRRKRSARRRLEDLEQERMLRESLRDWDDYDELDLN